jgi:hypothetical protein
MNTYRITWVNAQNRMLVTYQFGATVAAALAAFRRAFPGGNVANIAEASNV